MKNLIIAFAVALIPAGVSAQEKTQRHRDSFWGNFFIVGKHEIGISIFSADDMRFDKRNTYWMPSIFYRRYIKKMNAIRVSAEFRHWSYEPSNRPQEQNVQSSPHGGRIYRFDVRTGYERMFLLRRAGRIQPYLFAEPGAHYVVDEGWRTTTDSTNNTVISPYERHSRGFGITTGAGLRWRILSCLYIVLEADVYWYMEKTKEITTGSGTGYYSDATVNHIRTAGLSWLF